MTMEPGRPPKYWMEFSFHLSLRMKSSLKLGWSMWNWTDHSEEHCEVTIPGKNIPKHYTIPMRL